MADVSAQSDTLLTTKALGSASSAIVLLVLQVQGSRGYGILSLYVVSFLLFSAINGADKTERPSAKHSKSGIRL